MKHLTQYIRIALAALLFFGACQVPPTGTAPADEPRSGLVIVLDEVLDLVSSEAHADTIGNTGPGSSGTRAMDEVIRGIEVTMPAGTWAAGVTITARLENPTGTEAFTCAIYGSGANNAALLAESAPRTNITTLASYTFSGGGLATFTPVASTTYVIVCGCYDNADATITYDDGAGRNQSISGVNPTVMTVEPMNSDARTYAVYMTYTAASSGNLLLRRRRAANDDQFLKPVWERPALAANF